MGKRPNTATITILPEISKPNQIRNNGAMEISGIVCAADSNGNSAAFATREQYSRIPIKMPHATASRKPTVPSSNVTCVAGQSVGQVSTVA